jgi:hypothetical protein
MTISYVLYEDHAKQITEEFVEYYDHDYWLFKLKTNHAVLENLEEFVDQFGDDDLKAKPLQDYRIALQSEVVYSFFHTSEALLSLFISIWTEIPWLKMQHIGYRQICAFVREVLLEDNVPAEDIVDGFYFGVDPVALEKDEDFAASVEFIQKYLKTIGNRMLDNDLYRGYKHGLRLMTMEKSVEVRPDEGDGDPVIDESGAAHVYLESEEFEKEGKDEYHQVMRVTEWFDYDLYYQLCTINYRLIEQMFRSLQQMNNGEIDAEKGIEIMLFEYDLEELFDGSEWRVTEKKRYPVGEKAYELG